MINVSTYLFGSALLLVVILILICLILKLTSSPHPIIHFYPEEKEYVNPETSLKEPFSSLSDSPSVKLSVIVPSYNEEIRLPPMLDECLDYLENKQRKDPLFTYEIIIVDDGSSDKTSEIGLKYSKKYSANKVKVLTLAKNRGKGGAVRLGMLSARGEQLLFADADGATKFSDLQLLDHEMKELLTKTSTAIVVGSRAHLADDAVAERSIFRTILMYGFHFLVWLFTIRTIKDTQCGFKLLSREAAAILFKNMHVEKWAFDVELLFLAENFNIPIKEVAVNWQEIEGSKIVPVFSYLQMGKDLILIWLKYRIGAWRIRIDKN